MDTGPKIAQVAALVGDPARANMLSALMDGRTLTATELAYLSGVAPQTASGHLAKLSDARLLALERRGRRRYFRLASPLVARMLEGLMVVAQEGPARQRNLWRGGETLRHARTCYDHMAGRIAVAIADRLVQQSFILLDEDGGQLTDAGQSFFDRLGVDLCLASKRRVFCRPCLDWSERRPHLAGAVGAAILRHALDHAWVEHIRDSRALLVTPVGVRELAATFDIEGAPPTDACKGPVASLSRGRAAVNSV
ncbi:transcriptional regulator [Bradyrhizobium sp. UFLA03-84]|uniref:ArsR/SmtB family transcription factor n=1 Tax=Bradyrhizobium sp. UFLA03-84 TaxID=418599 RepID=UPI000BAE3836|nr:helix-turn-helix transcriptional regulator [Bradyrhizobium sp. UFLA03-84]PAY06229.1 transcriptional regulator [Bradyrhizobium sp. UFLA03-84]